jgi:uncharacterized protein YqgV (UPF0045/DUF77 family)
MRIQVEISLYPLGEQDPLRAIDEFVNVLRAEGLKPRIGTMSTMMVGKSETVFAAVAKAFEGVTAERRCVLVAKYSNASPPLEEG